MARSLSYVKVEYEGEAPDRRDYDKKSPGLSGYTHSPLDGWFYALI